MTGKERGSEPSGASLRQPGREAGFTLTRRELEEFAASELNGVVVDPKLLSHAGLWATFVAREPCCGARVLLNVRTRRGTDDDTIEEIFREASRSRDLRHPAVLSSRRFGTTDEVVWITTRAYRGRLLRLVSGSEQAGRARALEFLRRVAGPLEAVHRDGLVHGGLGEASFHCDTEGRVRIRNLGFDVPLIRSLADAGVETDTVAWAAPEILEGSAAQVESDQYALAALLVRTLTGRASASDDIEWHGVPGPMRRPLRRALKQDPGERFGSVLELWKELDPEGAEERPSGSGARRFGSPRPDDELPGSPRAGDRGHEEAAMSRTAGRRPSRPAPAPTREPLLPSDPPRRGVATSRRRGRRRRARGAGPVARTLAAVVALVLIFGTVELVGEWERILPFSPFATSSDTLAGAAGVNGAPDERESSASELAMPDPGDEAYARDLDRWMEAGATEDGSPEADSASAVPGDGVAADPARSPTAADATPEPPPSGDPERAPPSSDPAASAAAAMLDRVERRAVEASRPPGLLSIHTYPWGEVYLDGDYVGNSPIVELRVSAGQHEIRVERSGYQPHVERITIRSGEVARLTGIVLRGGG